MANPTLVATAVVVSLLLSTQLLGYARADHHHVHVVPDLSTECENSQQCFDFSETLHRADDFFVSNTLLEFSAGEYNILSDKISHNVTITGVTNVSLTGPHTTTDQVHINCHGRFRFDFVDCNNITIANIVFSGCGSWSELSSGALIFITISSLTVANVTVRHSHGYGLMAIRLCGDVTIHNCTFFNNSRREGYGGRFKMGGNCLLQQMNTCKVAALNISDSQFINGISEDVLEYDTSSVEQNIQPISGGGGLAIYLVNTRTILTIANSTFLNNSAQFGGNFLLQVYKVVPNVEITVSIINCTFHDGRAHYIGGGLHIDFYQNSVGSDSTKLWTEVLGSHFISNTAQIGGGLSVTVYEDDDTWKEPAFENELIFSSVLVTQNQAEKGGGMYIECKHWLQRTYINDSEIVLNYAESGSGLYLFIAIWAENPPGIDYMTFRTTVDDATYQVVSISFTTFTENKGKSGSALKIQGYGSYFNLETCQFPTIALVWLGTGVQINENALSEDIMYNGAAAVYVASVQWIVLEDTIFYNNTRGAIFANNSDIIMVGNVTFEGNYGYYGGAVQFDCNCESKSFQYFLFLMSSSHISITNNRALEYGGGIGISERCNNPEVCFFQMMLRWYTLEPGYHAIVEMRNNHAGIAGDEIYGASSIQCEILNTGTLQTMPRNGSFQSVFKVPNETVSSIASIPYRVCFCTQNSPNRYCLNSVDKTAFPGQEFTVSAATVGNHRGASPAAVQFQFIGLRVNAELGTRQDVQKLGRNCGDLTYSIRTTQSIIQLHLTVEGTTQTISSEELPAIVNVTILPCLLGFTEVGDPPQCGCMPHLSLAGVVCDINTQTHQCPAGMWIGNFSGGIVTHSHCPFDYCKPGKPNVSLTSQDDQCQYNRHGVLCGACQHGLSLSLGTSQCQKCCSVYLLLLLPFTLSGVVLVFLLLKCNLTVSIGTINGLVFYANIIRANNTIFFPRKRGGILVGFFSTFIAWLNLDLGIQVCFFNGLSTFGRAWLQFLFPAYIWILVGIMIVGSRYSTRMAKVVGNNAVPVLASLFLLSYSKLLRTVVDAASFTTITSAGGDMSAVWLVDGNLHFLNTPHIFLFLLSLAATLAYIIPFTVLVLLAPCLQAKSNYKLLHWVNKIKPLLDAYQGPYKDKFRFWTGLMLVIRAILFITFASNALGDPRVNLLAIIISLLLLFAILWNTGRIYKSYFIHIIECFYVLNLGVYAAATQFLTSSEASPHKQEQLAVVMVGSAFIVFCGVVLYHLYTQTRIIDLIKMCCSTKMKWLCPWLNKIEEREEEMAVVEDNGPEMVAPSANKPTVSVVDFNMLREPLLTEN